MMKTTVETVAIDIEGHNLGRYGSISLIQLSDGQSCCLIDVMAASSELLSWLKGMLEDSGIRKIGHDLRTDSDALYHLLNISLKNAYDTSVFHQVLTGQERASLNRILKHNGLPANGMRDHRIYRNNPPYWMQRPLTGAMVEKALGDVLHLHAVYMRQVAECSLVQMYRGMLLSQKNLRTLRQARALIVGFGPSFGTEAEAQFRECCRSRGITAYRRSPSKENFRYTVYAEHFSTLTRMLGLFARHVEKGGPRQSERPHHGRQGQRGAKRRES